jgi:hypothetical protein
MLNCLTSREITYWQVYERLTGPLDNSWRDEQLARLAELIQINTQVTGTTGQGKKNPAPKFQAITRPWELYEKAKKDRQDAKFSASAGGELILEEGEANPWQ